MKSILVLLTVLCFSTINYGQCIKGNCDQGYGVYLYPDGTRYEGSFSKSAFDGKGKLVYKDGDRYLGGFSKGKKFGLGKFYSADGSFYIGDFRDDMRSGKGKMTYANKDEYKGQWREDLPNGIGAYTFSDGSKYEGQILGGNFDGKGKMTNLDGSVVEGMWKESEMVKQTSFAVSEIESSKMLHIKVVLEKIEKTKDFVDCNTVYCSNKIGKYTYQDGTQYFGYFSKGSPDGLGICRYKNGSVYRGEWANHAPNGRGMMYQKNGSVVDADWLGGRLIKEYYSAHQAEVSKNKTLKTQKKSTISGGDGVTNIYALVVGIASYNTLPSLKYTDDDAYQVFAFLKSPEGGALPDNQIKILIDDAASKNQITKNMDQIFSQADEDDSIILYISGHGLNGSFVPYDFDGKNNLLAYEEILSSFDRYDAKSKLCITDACYSGSIAESRSGINFAIDDFYMKVGGSGGGTAIITSSKKEEVSLEYSGIRQGIFSHYLIKGLKGDADENRDKYVSLGELFKFVKSNVQIYTQFAQNPTISGKYDETMPIAFVR